MITKHYINLTNGVEAIKEYGLSNYSFIRIQSTACEQHLWDRLILDLDYDFLMNVAIGNECVIYDYGTNKPVPRALYQGVSFIEYALKRYWYGSNDRAYVQRSPYKPHANDVTAFFDKAYNALSEQTRRKLKYFLPFLHGGVNIKCVSSSTSHDNDKEFYARILNGSTFSAIV